MGDPRDGTQVWPYTLTVNQDFINDEVSFEVTAIPYSAPGPSENYKATLIVQNPASEEPSADVIEISWTVMNGPVALVSVQDKVCSSCESELYLEDSDTSAFTDFMESTISEDAVTQSWSIAVWGVPADRCVSPGGSVCEILTAKVKRKWSSFVQLEDLSFSDG